MQGAFPLLLLVGFFLIMWLLFVRPQQRRQRELALMQGSLEVGDEVMLTSGLYGELTSLETEAVHLEVDTGVVIKVARAAIARVVAPEDAGQGDGTESTDSTPHDQARAEQTRDEQTRDDDVPEEN